MSYGPGANLAGGLCMGPSYSCGSGDPSGDSGNDTQTCTPPPGNGGGGNGSNGGTCSISSSGGGPSLGGAPWGGSDRVLSFNSWIGPLPDTGGLIFYPLGSGLPDPSTCPAPTPDPGGPSPQPVPTGPYSIGVEVVNAGFSVDAVPITCSETGATVGSICSGHVSFDVTSNTQTYHFTTPAGTYPPCHSGGPTSYSAGSGSSTAGGLLQISVTVT